jgi:hypothetical protein
MSIRLRLVSAALVALVLAACTDVRSVNSGYPYQSSTARSYLAWAAAAGPVLLELRGNPFQATDQAAAAALAEDASGSVHGIPVRFTAKAGEAAHPDWRVVYAFNTGAATAYSAVCGAKGAAEPTQSGKEMTALLVFCNEAKPIIAASVWAKPVAGPGAEGFRALAQHSMRDLFPPESMPGDSTVDYPD